jgi:uncharacterized membrane protein HdeD (DUF308 family)
MGHYGLVQTIYILLIFIAAWALLTCIFEIFSSIRLHKVMSRAWVLTLVGVLSVLLAIILLASPAAGLLLSIFQDSTFAFDRLNNKIN